MNYQLKKVNDGVRMERTYEITMDVPRPRESISIYKDKTKNKKNISAGKQRNKNNISADTNRQNLQAQYNQRPGVGTPRRPQANPLSADGLRAIPQPLSIPAKQLSAKERAEARRAAKNALGTYEPEQRIRTIKADERKPFPVKIILISGLCTVLFLYLLYNVVILDNYQRDISNFKFRLKVLQSEKADLEAALDKKNDLKYIEEYAVTVLGMVKSDVVSHQYISIENNDKIELAESAEEGILDKIKPLDELRKTISKKIGELWEYIS